MNNIEESVNELLTNGNLLVEEDLFDDVYKALDERGIRYLFSRHDENYMYFQLPDFLHR